MSASLLARYRRSGADLPYGDPAGYHGTAVEGYFWRITEPQAGRVVVVMASVNRDGDGRRWGTAVLDAHPPGGMRAVESPLADADPRRLAVEIDGGRALRASERELCLRLDEETTLAIDIEPLAGWPRRALGGIGLGHLVPGLSQYWHPHLLGGRVRGEARIGGERIGLDGASVYAEKNWSTRGFPRDWWWGQAHGFADPDVCVAFAGGLVGVGGLLTRATAVVAAIGPEVIAAAQPVHLVRTRFAPGRWSICARTVRHVIEIEGHADGEPHLLPVPLAGARGQQPAAARQHLAARLQLRVRRGRRLVFAGESTLAGLERGAVGSA